MSMTISIKIDGKKGKKPRAWVTSGGNMSKWMYWYDKKMTRGEIENFVLSAIQESILGDYVRGFFEEEPEDEKQ